MVQTALDPQAVHDLQATLSGALMTRHDEDYDNARKVWNGMIDKYPALIARCIDATDVIAAVTFARKQGLAVAVRSGAIASPGIAPPMAEC